MHFDEAGLGTLVSSLHKEIMIHGAFSGADLGVDPDINPNVDFSIIESEDANTQLTIGTAMDFITSVRASNSGKALNGLDFPITYNSGRIPSYSTDAHAWNMTSGWEFCHSSYPFATMKWDLALTAEIFSCLHMDSNGHGTYVNVNVGTKIWYTLTPKPGKPFNKAFVSIDPFKNYHPDRPNSFYWDIETVVLQDGMWL